MDHLTNCATELLERDFRSFKQEILSKESPSSGENTQLFSDEAYLGRAEPNIQPDASPSDALLQRHVVTYCSIWFDEYHSWFPILHQPSVLEACRQYMDCPSTSVPVVLKAICAVIFQTQQTSPQLDANKWKEWFQDEIILFAIHHLCLSSLQALLILSIPIFGSGNMADFYNVLGVCKR